MRLLHTLHTRGASSGYPKEAPQTPHSIRSSAVGLGGRNEQRKMCFSSLATTRLINSLCTYSETPEVWTRLVSSQIDLLPDSAFDERRLAFLSICLSQECC